MRTENIAFRWVVGTQGKQLRKFLSRVPVLREVQVKSFSEEDEGGLPGSALRTAPRVWRGRSCRPGLLGSEWGQQTGEARSLTGPQTMVVQDCSQCVPGSRDDTHGMTNQSSGDS